MISPKNVCHFDNVAKENVQYLVFEYISKNRKLVRILQYFDTS